MFISIAEEGDGEEQGVGMIGYMKRKENNGCIVIHLDHQIHLNESFSLSLLDMSVCSSSLLL